MIRKEPTGELIGSSYETAYIRNPEPNPGGIRGFFYSDNWGEVLDERRIVLVNLQRRDGFENEERRLLGLQITTELFRRNSKRQP